MSEHKWEYVRTNSKGERIFRKDTNESLEFVCKYLDSNDIDYEVDLSASLIVVYNSLSVSCNILFSLTVGSATQDVPILILIS